MIAVNVKTNPLKMFEIINEHYASQELVIIYEQDLVFIVAVLQNIGLH